MARKKPKPPEDLWDVEYIESLAENEEAVKAARKVLNKGGFGKVESRADGRGWWVECQGMTGTYQVSVRPDAEAGVVAECTCPSRQRPCKHTLALLLYLAAHPEERIEPTAASAAQSVDLDALVRATFANPLDDTPRLVLADCVEELGQPARAALIRLQCESSHTGIGGARLEELKAEEKKLMPAVLAEMGPIPNRMTATFHRGFVALQTNFGLWGREIGSLPTRFSELFRDGWIETVSVSYARELPPWLIDLLRQVREVDFSGAHITDRNLVTIASDLQPEHNGARLRSVLVPTEFQQRYRELAETVAAGVFQGRETVSAPVSPQNDGSDWQAAAYRQFENLNPTQFALLARAGHLRGVQYLTLKGEIGDAGTRTLLATSGLDNLAGLDLTNSGIGLDGVKELVSAPLTGQLQRLEVIGSPIGDAGAAALCGATWRQLATLQLNAIGLTDAGAVALAGGHFPALTWMALADNALTRAGTATLLRSERFKGVTQWHLAGNPIPTKEWVALVFEASRQTGVTVYFANVSAELSHTTGKPNELHLRLTGSNEPVPGLFRKWTDCPRPVVSLVLSKLRFDATEATRLATALTARPVRELHINGCELRNEAMSPLASRLAEMKLDVLDLSDNEIGMHGAETLAAAPGLASVRVLLLNGNPLRPSGVDAIVESPHLTALARLVLPGKDLTAGRQKAIQTRLGKEVVVEFGATS